MHLLLNSLDDPISTGEAFPERKLAVSPSLSGIINQFISQMFIFQNTLYSPFHGHPTLGCQVPLQPRPWGASNAPSPGHSLHCTGCPGEGLLQGQAKEWGLPCSRHFHQSKQTRFSIPWGVCVRDVTLLSSCSQKKSAPTEVCTSLPHLASGVWVPLLGPHICLVTKVQLPESLMELPQGDTAPTQQPEKNESAEWILAFLPPPKYRRLGG